DVLGYPLRFGAEPPHRFGELSEFWAQVVLTVAAPKIASYGARGVAVKRGDGAARDAEDGVVHELGVVAVGLVLGDELPVRAGPMLQPAGIETYGALR